MTITPVAAGITSTGIIVTSGNELDVLNGGTAVTTTVQAGGLLVVELGGSDSGTTISSGTAVVSNGAVAAGTASIISGAQTAATILTGGLEVVVGSATGDQISGTQYVSGSGTALGTISNETVFNGGAVDLFFAGTVATGLSISSGGALNISGRGEVINTTLNTGATLTLQSSKSTISGGLAFAGGNAQLVVNAIASPMSAGSSFGDRAVITGFGTGDIIDVKVIAGGAITTTTAAGVLTATLSGTGGAETFMFSGLTAAGLRAVTDGAGGTEIDFVACYCQGTMIRTSDGDVAVEDLSIGDRVLTVDGAAKPIRWIGRRSYAGRQLAGRRHLQPVRIEAGALADGVPVRDLLVSPLHAMLIDGVLVPAHALINGTTVVRSNATDVHYVHIELARHDVVWAEGAASETFVDDDGRRLFQSSEGEPVSQPGDPTIYYAPRVQDGYALEAIRQRIAARAGSLTEA